jgi:hypothetical protein
MSSRISINPACFAIPVLIFWIGPFTSAPVMADDDVHWRPALAEYGLNETEE